MATSHRSDRKRSRSVDDRRHKQPRSRDAEGAAGKGGRDKEKELASSRDTEQRRDKDRRQGLEAVGADLSRGIEKEGSSRQDGKRDRSRDRQKPTDTDLKDRGGEGSRHREGANSRARDAASSKHRESESGRHREVGSSRHRDAAGSRGTGHGSLAVGATGRAPVDTNGAVGRRASGDSRRGGDDRRDRDRHAGGDRPRDRDHRKRSRSRSRDRDRRDRKPDDRRDRRGRDASDGGRAANGDAHGKHRERSSKRAKHDGDDASDNEDGELDEFSFGVEDPEEEERRLEQERQERRERLAALAAEKEAAAAAAAAEAAAAAAEGGAAAHAAADADADSDSTEGPIDIAKEGTSGATDADAGGGGDGGGGGGGETETVNSTALRAVAGKEDRPTFDMFSMSPSHLAAANRGVVAGPAPARTAHAAILGDEGDDPTLQSNWTDTEGYYRTRVGEMIEGRYKVLGTIGQGVFSTVLKCLDTGAGGREVALKMIRANDQMRKMAQREVAICRELAAHDPQCRKHCILMLASLEHKNHVVMVFESMQMNLRETLKKFGRRVGINVRAVRTYAHQLFVALRHLAARRVIHADIKPDNILVSQGFGCLKLADFGSAFHETDSDLDPTPYLVSRWYRAPEIILGLEYDRAIDTWSVAATLYELYMGASLFPGRDNNDMLAKMMELKGAFPPRMVKQHLRQFDKVAGLRPHFAEDLQFMLQEPDPITGKAKVRMTTPTAPTKTMRQLLLGGPHSSGEDRETVLHLADFLEKCLALDPKRRLTVADAFEHPFIKGR